MRNLKIITKSDPIEVVLVHRIADPEPDVFDLLDPDFGVQNAIRYKKKVISKNTQKFKSFSFLYHFFPVFMVLLCYWYFQEYDFLSLKGSVK